MSGFDDWFDDNDPFDRIFKDLMKRFRWMFEEFNLEPGKPIIRGFSMTIGPDGRPIIREFRPSGSRKEYIRVEGERKAEHEIIDEGGSYLIILDMPGVSKDKINIRISRGSLIVKAEDHKKYYEAIALPRDASDEILEWNYHNGVLTIKISKKRWLGKIFR